MTKQKAITILSIETSCDDTGIAILEVRPRGYPGNFSVLSNVVASQIEMGEKYGGVFPAMAKREHQKNLVPTLIAALKKSSILKNNKTVSFLPRGKKLTIEKMLDREPELLKKVIPFFQKYERPGVDLIAVTNGPGLEPCLWAGVSFARALSYFWGIPVIPVNHIESHILVNFLSLNAGNVNATAQLLPTFYYKKTIFPAICLVVSGGHTQIILMKKIGIYKILGETRDDAAGECFDKCAKILGLGYPGGPAIAALAAKSEIHPAIRQGAPSNDGANFQLAVTLPRPMINTKDYDFSFSGLKTAVLYSWQKFQKENSEFFATWQKTHQAQIAFATEIQQAIIDVLIKKTIKAVKDFRAKTLILGGGVSANTELRKQFTEELKKVPNTQFLTPNTQLSTDNGLMTAVAGYFHRTKKIPWQKLNANANLRIG